MVWQGNYSKLFVGGHWVEPTTPERITVTSPFTEQALAEVPAAGRDDVDQAVSAARSAFDHGPWRSTPLDDRVKAVSRLAAALGDRVEDAAALISDEMGCPITLSRTFQAGAAKGAADAFLELASTYPFEETRVHPTGSALVLREAVGVVAAVVPWNVPLTISVMKLVPALLAGCCVIIKPASEAPLNAYLLAAAVEAADLPDGVVSVLPADRTVSEYLIGHPGVDKVAFTGSTGVGQHIAAICGQNVRRVTLELGGKSAGVLLADADVEATVEWMRWGSLRNNGQACSLKTRLLVPRALENRFLDALTALVTSLKVGDPADPATELGPLVSSLQRDRVEEYVEIGRAEGAEVVTGGGRPAGHDRGWFVEPTVFRGVDPKMRIAQEEIFGPVLAVITYDTEDEAVAIANDSEFGLNGAVFSADAKHAVDIAKRIRTGTVEINGSPVGPFAPIGGFKNSGIGREMGTEGFDAYVEIKSIGLPPALTLAASP